MSRLPATLCRCPLCAAPFTAVVDERAPWRCPAGHSFDVAKDGSVHLVPSGHGRKVVGDDKAMLEARRRFFDRGGYRPLTAGIADAVVAGIAGRASPVVVDLGAGEGSHLRGVLDRAGRGIVAAGLDLAKDAVRMLARLCPDARGLVADCARQIPLGDGVVDVAVVAFAPRHAAELARVVRPGGSVVVAFPRKDHLQEVVAAFGGIGMADDKIGRLERDLDGTFDIASVVDVDASLDLDGAALTDLLAMTPHARHVDTATLDRATATTTFSVTLAATVVRARRR
jgi:23S rRNA (guanine745-N1)-methyltransferase